jgi:protein-L-isoaspartate(D-aspartate) O-methyltransferase
MRFVARASSAALRASLVDRLRAGGAVSSDPVARAMGRVPREWFVADHWTAHGLEGVYRDEVIVTRWSSSGTPISSSSQPSVVASMLELSGVGPGSRVLEIGTGTGYQAALLAAMVGRRGTVVSVEVDEAVADDAHRVLGEHGCRVDVVTGDGRELAVDGTPFDTIIVTAGTDDIPRAWFDQLRPGGRLVVPLQVDPDLMATHAVFAFERTMTGFRSLDAIPGWFMPLRDPGEAPPPPRRRDLTAVDSTVGPLVMIAGPGLERLSPAARRRLLHTALSRPQRRRLAVHADFGLIRRLALTLPRQRTLAIGPIPAVGLATPRGDGLVYAAVAGHETLLRRYGNTDDITTEILTTVRRWDPHRNPNVAPLVAIVTYDTPPPRSPIRRYQREHATISIGPFS